MKRVINISNIFLVTVQGINISHLGKRKIIFKMPFLRDMLVPWRVIPNSNGNVGNFGGDYPKFVSPRSYGIWVIFWGIFGETS